MSARTAAGLAGAEATAVGPAGTRRGVAGRPVRRWEGNGGVGRLRPVEALGPGRRPAGALSPRWPAARQGDVRQSDGRPGNVRHGGVRSRSGRLRLTARGRLVVRVGLALAAAALVGVAVLVASGTAVAGAAGRPLPVEYHVVLPGETLWSIAGEVAPGVDRRDTVAEIVELNALNSSGVSVGQRIALPARP